ncbi:MAG: ABC transporter permease [Anaerolineae bacterium]
MEAVITPQVAAISNFAVGTRFTIGIRAVQRVVINVVGIVEPIDPTDPFFNLPGVRTALEGEVGDLTVTGDRPIFPAFMVVEGAYDDWITNSVSIPPGGNNSYVWDVNLNPNAINADNITDVRGQLLLVTNKLTVDNPGLLVVNPLQKLLDDYADVVSKTEGPIILLSGAVLVMMLYHLVTTVNLVLEQQMAEWASMSSRGASIVQLVLLQGLTMIVLGVIGFIVGPFLAFLILAALAAVGPLASATGGVVPISGIPTMAFNLSLIAAALAVLMLTLPAIPAARRSLAQFKQMSARPPARPLWARYFLDVVLILLGFGFIARLLFYVEGDLSQTLSLLTSNPAALIQRIIDSANRSGGLADPLNLVGPALLLTGIALLWLRIFPLIMRLIGRITGRSNGLTGPLAVWNVERDPGHYAQLVLLLIGTLALGTAALALGTTRDQGAWSVAREDTGGDVRIELAPSNSTASVAWTGKPGVVGSSSVVYVPTVQQAGRMPQYMLGINPSEIAQTVPEAANAVQPLTAQSVDLVSGVDIPAGSASISLDIAIPTKASDARMSTPEGFYLWLVVADSAGRTRQIQATTQAFKYDEPMTYVASLTEFGDAQGLTLVGIDFAPYAATLPGMSGELRVDNLQSIDSTGTATMLFDFSKDQSLGWRTLERGGRVFATNPVNGTLRIYYFSQRAQTDPENADDAAKSLAFQPISLRSGTGQAEIPVIISERLAKDLGEATRRERLPLEVGMTGKLALPVAGGTINFTYKVVGIVRTFPPFEDNQQFLIFDQQTLMQLINTQVNSASELQGANQVWLQTAERQPSADLDVSIRAEAGVTNIAYAWDRYNVLLREPLPAALAGMLYAGFWVSLLLSLLDFAFYLVVTARRRSLGFAVLRSLGWNVNNIWVLLVAEQAALVVPALLVGIGLGAGLAYVILPFLALAGGQTLQVPTVSLLILVIILLLGFGALSLGAAGWLRRLNVNQVLRLGEE